MIQEVDESDESGSRQPEVKPHEYEADLKSFQDIKPPMRQADLNQSVENGVPNQMYGLVVGHERDVQSQNHREMEDA